MEFCSKCGSVLIKKKTRFVCVKCGKPSSEKIKIGSSEKMKEKQKIGLLREKDSAVWPVTSATCPVCGHGQAYFWSAQMRAADESETRFFRCIKCKHTWREYN